jgi:hypothetical protein
MTRGGKKVNRMRLIDADALIDGYKHMGYDPSEHPEESYMEGWCKGFNSAVDHCVHHAIHAPTIEARKKGRWIDKSGGIEDAWNYCSVCGEQAIDLYDYCPNCGADMRGE